jgi:fatty acid CoA ligase FadD9
MSTDNRDEQLARRMADLCATDPQFADARPNEAITAKINRPGVRMPELVRTVMESYADRPALGERAVHFVTDPETGRTSKQLLPRFDTITYRELWDRVGRIAGALAGDPAQPVRPGDRVAILGFASVDYTTIDLALIQLGAVSVPLQTSAPLTQLQPIVAETEPNVLAVSIDHLADAVELLLTGHAPARLVLFDYHPQVDEQRAAFDVGTARLTDAGSPVIAETLTDVLDRGKAPMTPPISGSGEDDPLSLLIYTSGSTGAPKGAMYPGHLVAEFWRRASRSAGGQHNAEPSITLCFMPMSHVMGRSTLYGSLGAGGTSYFAAKSDLSTLLEDLALVRPTQFNFVPRIWEMLFEEFQSELDRRSSDSTDRAALEAEVQAEQRQNLLGGRFVSAITTSAPISVEMKAWAESLLDMHMLERYGSTEAGVVFYDGRVRRPPVIDYKLADVPAWATSTPTGHTRGGSCWSNPRR